MSFSDELNKGKTKGSWKADFDSFCLESGATNTNPAIVFDKDVCKISNYVVQSNEWFALLNSLKFPELKILEISLYQVELSDEHISDLILLLNKISYLPVVKLEYLSFSPDSDLNKISESISVLFGSNINIDYISIRGTHCTDLYSKIFDKLKSNVFIKAINFTDNILSAEDSQNLINAIKFCPSLKFLSLSNCNCDNHFIESIIKLRHGITITNDEENNWKKQLKNIADKINKDIKDKNKNRKKLNIEIMIPEISAQIPFLIEKNKDGSFILKSYVLSFIDFSNNKTIETETMKSLLLEESVSYPTQANYSNLKILLTPTDTNVTAAVDFELVSPRPDQYGDVTVIYNSSDANF